MTTFFRLNLCIYSSNRCSTDCCQPESNSNPRERLQTKTLAIGFRIMIFIWHKFCYIPSFSNNPEATTNPHITEKLFSCANLQSVVPFTFPGRRLSLIGVLSCKIRNTVLVRESRTHFRYIIMERLLIIGGRTGII